jgi:hypothetical protein
VASDGGIFSYGNARFQGSTGGLRLNRPVVGMAATPTGKGYWLVASDGGIFTFGDAPFLGSTGGLRLVSPVVGMAATPSGAGYWLVAADGGVFTFGDAPFLGSAVPGRPKRPVVAIAATPAGRGYWVVAADGSVYPFGDAAHYGSMAGVKLGSPIVGLAVPPGGHGYWLVAGDGGVFSFGDAPFKGSLGGTRLNRPIISAAATPRGQGYWLVAGDGGVFSFGDAAFFGSTGSLRLNRPVVGLAPTPVRFGPEVSTFFYPWWGRPPPDGPDDRWRHWAGNGRQPPADVASNYYPARGPYSSHDLAVANAQMAEIAAAGIETVVSSWWGRDSFEDQSLPVLTAAAAAHGVRVAIHMEPYVDRTTGSVGNDILYLNQTYGLTDFYVYLAPSTDADAGHWAAMNNRVPGLRTMVESGSIASNLNGSFADWAARARFDGIYTYDAVRYNSNDLARVCGTARQERLLCGPSVAPGFVAFRLQPNNGTVVNRDAGGRYDSMWQGAMNANADIVTITSYNEWHEGTQIEPAVPYCFPDGSCSNGYEYAYGTHDAAATVAYLDRTRMWTDRLRFDRRP